MDPRLDFLLKRHNVQVRLHQNIQRPAYLTRLPSHTDLAVQFGVHGPELNEVVAIQLARLMLGQLDGLNKDGATKLAEWREAVLEAAKLLIPDEAVEQAEQEGWPPNRLADHCAATDLLVQARLEERLIRRDLAPYLDGGMSWEEIVRTLEKRFGES
jgi:hypothetical protein